MAKGGLSKRKIKVLFAASEMAPVAKVGGLGDVIGSLPKALRKIGVDARVIVPFYENIKKEKELKIEFLGNVFVKLSKEKERAGIFKTRVGGVEVFLIENKKYLSAGEIYFSSTAFISRFAEIERFLFFSAAAAEILRNGALPFKPDVVHANDWHTGALISFLKTAALPLKTVFTVHNLGNQGKWNAEEVEKFFGKKNIFRRFGSDFNFMAEGISSAGAITTVSPSYAKEILTKQYGENLENILKARKKHLKGILNGVDYDFFNPAKDDFLFKKYSLKNSAAKEANKLAFQKRFGLETGAKIPFFGMVSRLTGQKGVSIILAVCGDFVEKYGCQFAFLGTGEPNYEKELTELAKKYPRNVFVKIGFNEGLARKIYAASDFFLMPSRFEPCGLGQMISLKYGTIPIVRETGGLKDTIKNKKNGFTFVRPDPTALSKAINEALNLFQNEKKFAAMKRRCMAEDFSWDKSADEYKRLYGKLLISKFAK